MAPYCEDAPDYVNVFLNCERCDLHGTLLSLLSHLNHPCLFKVAADTTCAAMLTTLGFAGLLTFGVFVSRYLRYRAWWWGLHLLAQVRSAGHS